MNFVLEGRGGGSIMATNDLMHSYSPCIVAVSFSVCKFITLKGTVVSVKQAALVVTYMDALMFSY